MRTSARFASRVPTQITLRISVAIGWLGCRQDKEAQFVLDADTTVGISVPMMTAREEARDRHRGYVRASRRGVEADYAMARGFAIPLVFERQSSRKYSGY